MSMVTATDRPRRPAHILIVDDEPDNRMLLEIIMRSEGYTTVCAASGEEALATVASHPPDLILLDLMMPGMDGFQVTARVKGDGATRHIPVMVISAMSDRATTARVHAAGAEDVLSKPIDRRKLCEHVRELLRAKPPNLAQRGPADDRGT
jgi:diguanylate cyclase